MGRKFLAPSLHILWTGQLDGAVEGVVPATGPVGGGLQSVYGVGSGPVCQPAVGQGVVADGAADLFQQVPLKSYSGISSRPASS